MELYLTGGEKDFNLIFDSDADVLTAALKSSIMEEAQPRPVWHMPDGQDGNELIDAPYDDGRMALRVVMEASTWPDLLREVEALRRTIRQAHRWAAGEESVSKVSIKGRPDSTCNWTYYDVKLVEDRTGGWLSGVQVPNTMIDELSVTCTVSPAGYGDAITLANEIRNGHAMIESATSGLAAGWTLTGAPTPTLDTTHWLNGGQSQKLVTDASGTDGVYYQVTCAAGSLVSGYAWVYKASGDTVTVSLYGGGGALVTSKAVSAANASRTCLDGEGASWYRIDVIGSVVAANARLAVERLTGGASAATTYYVDNLYMETGLSATLSGVELLTNTGFETGGTGGDYDGGNELDDATTDTITGWTNGGTGSGDLVEGSATANGGGVGLMLTYGNDGCNSAQYADVAAGSYYRLRFYTQGDGSVAGRYRVYNHTNSASIIDTATTGVTAASWTVVDIYFKTPATCVRAGVLLYSPGAAGVARFDDVSLQLATIDYVLPDAWADYPQIYNRNDPTAANPERVDRLDVWGIPGDMPAWMRLTLDCPASPTGLRRLVMGRIEAAPHVRYVNDSGQPAGRYFTQNGHILEGESATGDGSNTADSYCSGGYYRGITADGTFSYNLNANIYNGYYHIFARMYTTTTDNTVALSYGLYNAASTALDAVSNAGATVWQRVYLGTVNLRTTERMRAISSSAITLELDFDIASGSMRIDYLLLVPCGQDSQVMFVIPYQDSGDGDLIYIDGDTQTVTGDLDSVPEDRMQRQGGLWELEPGFVTNRLIFSVTHDAANNGGGVSDNCWIAWDSLLTLQVIPRTRGWLP